MKSTFVEMAEAEMVSFEGGNLAYDLGRVIRLIGLAGGGTNPGSAMADWYATTVINNHLANQKN